MEKLVSAEDASVNFVEEQLEGFLESRYVRRRPEYFVAYLSSHNGCNKGCRFCHLTATRQTSFKPATRAELLEQAQNVFEHYEVERSAGGDVAEYVHFNFMARGEPMSSAVIRTDGDAVLTDLGKLASKHAVYPKFNISTIMPLDMSGVDIHEVFWTTAPTIYYSLYSINDSFRKKWLPAAMPYRDALRKLKKYQDLSKKIVKIHFAFIDGENDNARDVAALVRTMNESGLQFEMNIVRYNPFSPEQGKETEKLDSIVEYLKGSLDGKVKVIQRVGRDVYASCGTFVGSDFG
jgi:adenine C2-methylase RlmN of 23S rRNA A2503 and tRNA A37